MEQRSSCTRFLIAIPLRSLGQPAGAAPCLSVELLPTGRFRHTSWAPSSQRTFISRMLLLRQAQQDPRVVGNAVAAVLVNVAREPAPVLHLASILAPIASLFPSFVRRRNPIQFCRAPTWFSSNRTGPLLLKTTASVSPSLSMSPQAAPRLTSSLEKAGPASRLTSTKRRPPSFAGACLSV